MNEVITCPHCKEPVLIEKLNCGIFRHGQYKTTGKQVGPHSSKEKCDNLIRTNAIYGCGKPFQIKKTDEGNQVATECDYI
jgi:hypothetical protein